MIIKTVVKEIYLNNNQIRRVKFKGNVLFPNLTDIDLRYHVIILASFSVIFLYSIKQCTIIYPLNRKLILFDARWKYNMYS